MAGKPKEPPIYMPPESAKELLARYAAGERRFTNAYLLGSQLVGADLDRATLCDADLCDADLCGANLRGANLIDAKLRGAKLRGVTLAGSYLRGADLSGADLRSDFAHRYRHSSPTGHTDLSDADVSGAKLIDADLRHADLSRSDLRGADFSGAHLCDTHLVGADFTNANLRGALLQGAELGATSLCNVDLAPFCEANPPVVHTAESTVDFKSIVRSLRSPRLEDFLVRTGLPTIAAQYMIDCANAVGRSVFTMMRSTFLSYGAPDEAFAKRLYEALHRNGVKVFLFSEHAEPGERLHRMMRKGVNEHDRVVLICSKSSLDRKGVMNELEETLAREAREGGETYLVPIRLDDYVFTGWKPKREDIAQAVRDRVVADFEGADTNPAKFDDGVSKLLRALTLKKVRS